MQTIYLDISNKGVVPVVYAKQRDVGRKFQVVLTDSGLPYTIPSGSVFSVWYSGKSGEGNYTGIGDHSAFVVSENKVLVEMITQMLSNSGDGILCLSLNESNGNQIGFWNIPYLCESVPGVDSNEAEAYYTAFSEAVANLPYPDTSLSVPGKAADAAATGAALSEKLPGIESASFPGCFYRTVNGVTEWVNPPMVAGVEYRTTERWNGHPVYQKMVPLGALPNAGVVRYNNVATFNHIIDLRLIIKTKDEIDAAHPMAAFSGVSVYGSSTASIWAEAQSNLAVNTYSWDASNYIGFAMMKYVK